MAIAWDENPEADKKAELEEVQFLLGWNSFPRKVVEARYVEQFKAELDEAWKDIRFLYTVL